MFFKTNTLSETDTVNIVATVAMVSLKQHYQGGHLLSASQRNTAASQLIKTVLGDCSQWHKSKLMAFADTLIKAVINQPTLDAYYSRELLRDKLAVQAAKKELSLLAFTGLVQNGLIAGHTASEWEGSTSVSKIVNELDEGMDAYLEKLASEIHEAILPQFEKHDIKSDKEPSEIALGYMMGYTDGVLQCLKIMDDESLYELNNLVVSKFFEVKVAMKLAQLMPDIPKNITPNIRLGLQAGMGDAEARFNDPDYEIRNLTDLVEAGRQV